MECSGGSDWESIRVLRINETGGVTFLNDTLNNVKFSSTAWSPDNKVWEQTSCPQYRRKPREFPKRENGLWGNELEI